MGEQPLRVLMMAAEMVPFAKTGEVSEVVAALSQALVARGHDVRVALPRYGHVTNETFGLAACCEPFVVPMDHRGETAMVSECRLPSGVIVYLIDNPRYFSRPIHTALIDDADPFIFYCRAVLEFLRRPATVWRPDLIHCHDWQTAIVPNWLATLYQDDPVLSQVATMLTVHRLSHQGIFGYRVLEAAGIEQYGFIYHDDLADMAELVDLLGRGIYYADTVTTVSESYAREIQTPEFGEDLDPLFREKSDRLFGVINGIDTTAYDPATDPYIAAQFSVDNLGQRAENKRELQRRFGLAEREAPLIGLVSRLVDAKGFDILLETLPHLLRHLDLQIAIIGVGDARYHELLAGYARRYPDRFGLQLTFNDALERQLYAGSDMYLRPSYIEPCGLGQMLAMRYGAVPIVRATGGLADTVSDYDATTGEGHGFVFALYEAMALYTSIVRAVQVYADHNRWRELQERCLSLDFSWKQPAARYETLYRQTLALHQS